MVFFKVRIFLYGKFVGILDLIGCLNIFKLDGNGCFFTFIVCGERGNGKEINNIYFVERNLLDDIVDFIWWFDYVCIVVKKDGVLIMFDVINGKKLFENDFMFFMFVVERINYFLGNLFVLDISLFKENKNFVEYLEVNYIFDVE